MLLGHNLLKHSEKETFPGGWGVGAGLMENKANSAFPAGARAGAQAELGKNGNRDVKLRQEME